MRSLIQQAHKTAFSPQFLRYIAVGLASTGTYFAVFAGTITGLDLDVWLAASLAFMAGLCVSYAGNVFWTFGSQPTAIVTGRYLTVVAVSFLANLIVAALLDAIGTHFLIIFCVEAVMLTMLNYAGHTLWTFRQTSPSLPPHVR